MQKRNLTPELIKIALPLLKAGVKPKDVADKRGIKREAVVRLCTRQRKKTTRVAVRYVETPE